MARKLTLITIALLLLLLGALLLLQTPFVKKEIQQRFVTLAAKKGFTLRVGKVGGILPLKWEVDSIEVQLSETESVELKHLLVRLSLIELIRGEFTLNYLAIKEVRSRFLQLENFKLDYESLEKWRLGAQELSLFGIPYKNCFATLQAPFLTLQGDNPTLPLKGSARLSLPLDLQDIALSLGGARFVGNLTAVEEGLLGSLYGQIPDLSEWNRELQGTLAILAEFKGKEKSASLHAKNLEYRNFFAFSVESSLSFTSGLESFEIEATQADFLPFTLGSFKMSAHRVGDNYPFTLGASGKWKDPFSLSCEGSLASLKETQDLHVHKLEGTLLKNPFSLQKPFSLCRGKEGFTLSELALELSQGSFTASCDLSPHKSKIRIKASHFPIDLLALTTPRFSLQGSSSLEIALDGSSEELQGRASLILEEAGVLPAGKNEIIHSRGAFQLNLDKNIAQIHAHLFASDQEHFELSASLPISYSLYPFHLDLAPDKPLFAELTMEGHLEEIFDFINLGSHRTSGLVSANLIASGTLEAPALQGKLNLQEGVYENYFTGMEFHHIEVDGRADKDHLFFSHISGEDLSGGKVEASGSLKLSSEIPFDFDAQLSSLRLLNLGWLSASASGDVTLTGSSQGTLARGSLLITEAKIEIPDTLPVTLPTLPVTYINEPVKRKKGRETSPTYPFRYDLTVEAPKEITLRGHGLSCDLGGSLHITGENLNVGGSGSLHLLKGKFSFAGKDFTLTQGEISFVPQAYLNAAATLNLSDYTITATLRGPLTSPVLSFQSNPHLPTSSILARILFNKEASELSASQALQLADAIISLSGGAGPNVLEAIRKNLRIDRLNIVSSANSDEVAVQIGKYLTEGVMITLSQSTTASQVIVEVELGMGFQLQAETEADDQGKFSLKWNKNY